MIKRPACLVKQFSLLEIMVMLMLAVMNDNSSPSNQPNKGQNTANNTLIKKLSYSDVSPKE